MDSDELLKSLNGIADPHERRLAQFANLQRRLTDRLAGLPLRDGVLFDLDAALALRAG